MQLLPAPFRQSIHIWHRSSREIADSQMELCYVSYVLVDLVAALPYWIDFPLGARVPESMQK